MMKIMILMIDDGRDIFMVAVMMMIILMMYLMVLIILLVMNVDNVTSIMIFSSI